MLTKKPSIMQQGHSDNFQTPSWILEPLYPYLKSIVWEPAYGKGNLFNELVRHDFCVVGTDIIEGDDFLAMKIFPEFNCIVTNPPYTLKDEFLSKCYEINKPFALLLPLTALEGIKRQNLYRKYGLEMILLPRRVEFTTPSGKVGGSWFATAWFTNGFHIGKELTFWKE